MISFGFTRLPLTRRDLVTRTIKEFDIVSTLGGVVPADVITMIREQIWKISQAIAAAS